MLGQLSIAYHGMISVNILNVCLAKFLVESKIGSVVMEKIELGKIGGEPHLVSLRSVIPAVPQDEAEKMMLVEDLTRIGCKDLLTHPRSLRSEEMVREFSRECSNEWEGTLRRDLERWTAKL